MVLSAVTALSLTNTAISNQNTQEVQQEVTNAETAIRQAASFEQNSVLFNAKIVGNPITIPPVPINQLTFYNNFIQAGYTVNKDLQTGYWSISWAPSGPEHAVNVYSFRTTIVLTNIATQTEAVISSFFSGLTPVINSVSVYNGSVSGDYQITTVVTQNGDTTDYSAQLLTTLEAAGLGFTGGNSTVTRIV